MNDNPSLVLKSRFRRFLAWFGSHKIITAVIALGILLLAAGVTYMILASQPKPAPVVHETIKPPEPPQKYYSLLNGIEVKTEASLRKPVTAVIIENSPDARPQSGLKQAEVVYEAIAEGGITRYMVLYQQNAPSLIGPVRSLRPYFLDYATSYHASIAHIGGSTKALKAVRNGNYRDIDQFFNAASYWRSPDRYAPHNVYTDSKHLAALNKSKGYVSSTFTSFQRVDGTPASKPTARTFYVNFSSGLYNTKYTYQAKCNCYNRYLAGSLNKDRERGTITPSVVVALHVDESTVMEDWWRERIKTSGQGKAEIFQNGNITEATWSKKNQAAPLRLIDADGKDIPLVRGQTWIAVVPNDGGSVKW